MPPCKGTWPAVRVSWQPDAMTWRCSGMRMLQQRRRSPSRVKTYKSVLPLAMTANAKAQHNAIGLAQLGRNSGISHVQVPCGTGH